MHWLSGYEEKIYKYYPSKLIITTETTIEQKNDKNNLSNTNIHE